MIEAPRYRVRPLVIGGGSGSRVPVSLPSIHFRMTMPEPVARALNSCRAFDSISGHASYAVRNGYWHPELKTELEEVFQRFCQAGLLVSERDLAPTGCRDRSAPARIGWVGVVTSGRPHSLLRCLRSIREHTAQQGRRVSLVIADDSADPACLAQNRAAVDGLQAEMVHYLGPPEKRELLERFENAGLPPEIVHFALFGISGVRRRTGANRNALLLRTVGRMLLSVDDDVVLRAYESPEPTSGIAPTVSANPAESWFYPDFAAAQRAGKSSEVDLLSAHESLLGRNAGVCLAEGMPAGRSPELSDRLFESMLQGSGRVVLTFSGIVGDSALGSAQAYLALLGPTRRRLVESRESYRTAVTSRCVVRVSRSYFITDGAFCMAYAFGLDQRRMLPPFLPVGRNQDGLFGAMVRYIYPPGISGHIPYAVLHDPPEQRCTEADSVSQAANELSIAGLLVWFVPDAAESATPLAADRMRQLGREFLKLGRLPPEEFEDRLREAVRRMIRRKTDRLESVLKQFRHEPDFWALDCERSLERLADRARQAERIIPDEVAPDRPFEERLCLMRKLFRNFGELVALWPDMLALSHRTYSEG